MRARALFLLPLVCLGCHHDKYGLKTKYEEQLVAPPDEPRYNNPPQSEWKKPPPKQEFKPGPGMGGASMGRGGM